MKTKEEELFSTCLYIDTVCVLCEPVYTYSAVSKRITCLLASRGCVFFRQTKSGVFLATVVIVTPSLLFPHLSHLLLLLLLLSIASLSRFEEIPSVPDCFTQRMDGSQRERCNSMGSSKFCSRGNIWTRERERERGSECMCVCVYVLLLEPDECFIKYFFTISNI